MDSLFNSIDINQILFFSVIGLAVLVLIFIILTIVNIRRLKKISRNSKNGNLGAAIEMYYDKVEALTDDIRDMSQRFTVYEQQNALSFKKSGIVHFNAFGDISGKLSFSLALLNDKNDGIILTSLYGHETSNIYLREVKAGTPSVTISEEELQALEQAVRA